MSPTQTLLLERIVGAEKWQTYAQLCDLIQRESGTVSPALAELVESGAVQSMKPPPGFAKGTHKIYAEAGLAPLDGAVLADGGRKAEKSALPKKLQGNRAALRERQRKSTRRQPSQPNTARIRLTPAGAAMLTAPLAPRWALTADGAFINLGDNLELGKTEARALANFVRALDEAAA